MSGPTRVVLMQERFELRVTTLVSVAHANDEEGRVFHAAVEKRLRPHAGRLTRLIGATLRRYESQPDALTLQPLTTPAGPEIDALQLLASDLTGEFPTSPKPPLRLGYRCICSLADDEVEAEVVVQVDSVEDRAAVAGLGRVLCRLLGIHPGLYAAPPPPPPTHRVWPVTSASPRVLVEARCRRDAQDAEEAAQLHGELKATASRVRTAIEHELAEAQQHSPRAIVFPAEETPHIPSAGTVAGFRFSLTSRERELLVAIRCQTPGSAGAGLVRAGVRRFSHAIFSRVREARPGEEVEPETGWILRFEDEDKPGGI